MTESRLANPWHFQADLSPWSAGERSFPLSKGTHLHRRSAMTAQRGPRRCHLQLKHPISDERGLGWCRPALSRAFILRLNRVIREETKGLT